MTCNHRSTEKTIKNNLSGPEETYRCMDCGLFLECGHANLIEKEVTFKNGAKHIELRCRDCGKFMQYKPQGSPYKFYFGKYKDRLLSEVMSEDFEYVYWCLENWEGKKHKKLQEAIDQLAKL